MSNITKVVIPAAGVGKRFYPLTRAQPKEMLPIIDKPIIQYVVEEAINSGLDEILIVVGKGKDSIIDYFDKSLLDDKEEFPTFTELPDIYFVRQKDPIGLANSIAYAKRFVGDDDFVVLLGDTIYISNTKDTVTSQLINIYKKWNASTVAVERVPENKIIDYGIISGKQIEQRTWLVDEMVEKPDLNEAPSDIGITGSYILTPDIFDKISELRPGRNGEYQLTDAIRKLCDESKVIGYEFEGKRYDIGTKELWIKTFIDFAGRDKRFYELL